MRVGKYAVQGMIYRALGDSEYGLRHDDPRFKFFTFSDMFTNRRNISTLIISSPISDLIRVIQDWILSRNHLTIDGHKFVIDGVRVVNLRPTGVFESGSPVTLYRDSASGEYFSFRRDGDVNFFLERLAENAVKKYEAFTGRSLRLNGPIFDEVELRKEVAVTITKYSTGSQQQQMFVIIGSVWKSLIKHDMGKHWDFYKFLMDVGLGEKNSLGFGFINPVRERR